MFDGGCGDGEAERRAELHRLLDDVLDAEPSDSGSALGATIEGGATLVRSIEGRVLGLVPGFDASGQWAIEGFTSTAAWLMGHTARGRISSYAVRRTALDVASLPHVSAAARRGSLPFTHLRLLAQARKPEVQEAFDEDEADLVAEAEGMHADALAERLRSWRLEALERLARNEPDGDPPLPPGEADRLTQTTSFEGRGVLNGDLTPESNGIVSSAIGDEIDDWRRSGSLDGDTRSRAELNAAAMVAIITRGRLTGTTYGGPRPLVVAVADFDTLLRRAGIDPDERETYRSDLIGGGPVASRTVRRLLCDARVTLLIADDGDPLWLGRTKRTATYGQWQAILARSGGRCEVPGCDMPEDRCQVHHLDPWVPDGETDVDRMALVCHCHHTNIHDRGFALIRGPDGFEYLTPAGWPIDVPYGRTA